MGLKFNLQGFVIRLPGGLVVQDSRVSAATGKPVRQAGVLKPVPGNAVLFLRLHRDDELKGAPAKTRYAQAREWFTGQQAAAEGDPDGEGEQSPDAEDGDE